MLKLSKEGMKLNETFENPSIFVLEIPRIFTSRNSKSMIKLSKEGIKLNETLKIPNVSILEILIQC